MYKGGTERSEAEAVGYTLYPCPKRLWYPASPIYTASTRQECANNAKYAMRNQVTPTLCFKKKERQIRNRKKHVPTLCLEG